MQSDTLSATNIAPENRPSPKESSHPSTIVEGYVRFMECLDDIVQVLNKENMKQNSFYARTFTIDSCTNLGKSEEMNCKGTMKRCAHIELPSTG